MAYIVLLYLYCSECLPANRHHCHTSAALPRAGQAVDGPLPEDYPWGGQCAGQAGTTSGEWSIEIFLDTFSGSDYKSADSDIFYFFFRVTVTEL